MIIGLSGKRGSGKTTLSDFLSQNHLVESFALAQVLKDRVALEFGLTKDELYGNEKEFPLPDFGGKTPREIMIAYGQFFRSIDPQFWIKQLKLEERATKYGMVSVSDVRFRNEADYIRARGGIIVRLERDPKLNIYGPTEINDISETDLDTYPFDLILPSSKNVDMKDLELFAEQIYYYASKPKALR